MAAVTTTSSDIQSCELHTFFVDRFIHRAALSYISAVIFTFIPGIYIVYSLQVNFSTSSASASRKRSPGRTLSYASARVAP